VSAPRELNNAERREQNFSDSSVYLLADESRGANLFAWDQDQDQKKCSSGDNSKAPNSFFFMNSGGVTPYCLLFKRASLYKYSYETKNETVAQTGSE
jgi:hypothetical protein